MLYRNVIHGDLSAYNVLVWDGRATSSTSRRRSTRARTGTARAARTRRAAICDHFERYGVRSAAGRLAGDLWTAWEYADLVPEELRTGIEL